MEVEATDNIGTTKYGIRDREDRDVYFIKWGRTPSSSFIFYYALLVSNETPSRTPTTTVQGFTFSWAMENRELIKHCPAVLSNPLNCVKELEMKFFSEVVGHTKSANEDILQISESADRDHPITPRRKPRRIEKIIYIDNSEQFREGVQYFT